MTAHFAVQATILEAARNGSTATKHGTDSGELCKTAQRLIEPRITLV